MYVLGSLEFNLMGINKAHLTAWKKVFMQFVKLKVTCYRLLL